MTSTRPAGQAVADPGRRAGAGQHRRQADDPAARRADGLTATDQADGCSTGGTACTLGGTVKAPCLPAQRWGHVRQLDPAGPGLGRWGRSRRRVGPFQRDLRTGQGGRPPPRLYRQAGLPPAGPTAPATCTRLHPAGRWDGSLRRGQRTSYGPTAGSTLMAWYPSAARWIVRFSITIRQHKSLRRGDTRGCLAPFPTGSAPPMTTCE